MTASYAALLRGIRADGAKRVPEAGLRPLPADRGPRDVSAGPGRSVGAAAQPGPAIRPGAVATTRDGNAARRPAEASRG
ncbi:hypothetical protein NPS70_01445 [Streptomyces sp. C10-9-1]|uniref:hypothetical protein n=1 Tax=Streptomyces sp. C10-9-1 TaxID=1859285 RepID=UPI002110EDDB|nr:hypothetical protein [Streptomyces sp. C10-9-1]MCQ6551872.1 hypothetical protein [Streptomyces sp. C10-9-1]